MRIAILAAGAGGMICGSCMRDNALAGELRACGHDAVLIPLYSPLRTDTADNSSSGVFYGAVNVWLQYASGLFRRTPRFVDWLLDRSWLLRLAGRIGAQTPPAKLGDFVLSVLRGEDGPQTKEMRRLIDFLRTDVKPEVVSLPNAMFIGLAGALRREVGARVVCELTGEDIFLDALGEPHRSEARRLISGRTGDVDAFVATSRYYAQRMAEYLDVPAERIAVVHPGVPQRLIDAPRTAAEAGGALAVGYLARICPQKGLDRLLEAVGILRRMPGMSEVRLRVAGYLGAMHRRWFEMLRQRVRRLGLEEAFEYVGEVDFEGKREFLDTVDVFSVPATHPEAKGTYVLEALARAVPVVLPATGAFVELVEQTGGGLLCGAPDAQGLARGLAELLSDGQKRMETGRRGREAVRTMFTTRHMALRMLEVYDAAGGQRTGGVGAAEGVSGSGGRGADYP